MAQMSRNDSFGLVLLASATLFLYSGIRMSHVVIVVVPHRCGPVLQLYGVSRCRCVVLVIQVGHVVSRRSEPGCRWVL